MHFTAWSKQNHEPIKEVQTREDEHLHFAILMASISWRESPLKMEDNFKGIVKNQESTHDCKDILILHQYLYWVPGLMHGFLSFTSSKMNKIK